MININTKDNNLNVRLLKEQENDFKLKLESENTELKKALDKVSAHNLYLCKFLAESSHNIKSCLTSILCWSELLKNKNLTEEKSDLGIQLIEESCLLLNQLINNLFSHEEFLPY